MRVHRHATKIGLIGLAIWSSSALINTFTAALPTFEIISFALGGACIAGTVYTLLKGTFTLRKPSLFACLSGIAFFCNEIFYISSFKFAPASHIVLITYLWPIIVVSLIGILPNERFSTRAVLAAFIGFSSVLFVIYQDNNISPCSEYGLGYLLAFIAAICWSGYILINRGYATISTEMMTIYCGLGFMLAFPIHLSTEEFIFPTLTELGGLLWMGIMLMFAAYSFWNFGTKYGKIKFLSVMSYCNVLLSSFLLILFNRAPFNYHLAIALIGLVIASCLSVIKLELLKEKYLPSLVNE